LFVEYDVTLFDPDIREFSDDSTDSYFGDGTTIASCPITDELQPFDGAMGTLGTRVTIDPDNPQFTLSFREAGIYLVTLSSLCTDLAAYSVTSQEAPQLNAINGTALTYNFRTREYDDNPNHEQAWARVIAVSSVAYWGGGTDTAIISVSDPATDTVEYAWATECTFGSASQDNFGGSLLITKLDSSAVTGSRIPLSQRASCPGLRASHGVIEAYHNKRRAERGAMLTRALTMIQKKDVDRKNDARRAAANLNTPTPLSVVDSKSDSVVVSLPVSATAAPKTANSGSSKNGWFK
jgi:hypothetical protein